MNAAEPTFRLSTPESRHAAPCKSVNESGSFTSSGDRPHRRRGAGDARGDKPYVVSPKGQVDLATRGLTFDAVAGLLNQLLPQDSQRALDEFGAAQYELPGLPEFPGEHF